MNEHSQPPEAGKQLFENLFVRREGDATFKAISDGLVAVFRDANRLIDDVNLLAQKQRFASAAFLLTTTNEEIAKFYILADMCRLDHTKHRDALKRLCRAFYSHVAKHAYTKAVRFGQFHDMNHAKEIWDIGVTRWWPSFDPESGEPDMPHETYFAREMPLYVEFIDDDQKWFTPSIGTGKDRFEAFLGTSDLDDTREGLNRLHATIEADLFKPECLSAINEVFHKHYITTKTRTDLIDRLYAKLVKQLESDLGIAEKRFWGSALDEWPLYYFVAERL